MEQRVRGSEEAAAILAVEEARPGERLRPLADALLPRPAVLLPMARERRGPAKWGAAVCALDVMVEMRADVGEGVQDAYGGRLPTPAPFQRAHPGPHGPASGDIDKVCVDQMLCVGRGSGEVWSDGERLRAPGLSRKKEAALEVHVAWTRQKKGLRGGVGSRIGSTFFIPGAMGLEVPMVRARAGGSVGHGKVKLVGRGSRVKRVARMNRGCYRLDPVPLRHDGVQSERIRERARLHPVPGSR
jgi:hypothetical protein